MQYPCRADSANGLIISRYTIRTFSVDERPIKEDEKEVNHHLSYKDKFSFPFYLRNLVKKKTSKKI